MNVPKEKILEEVRALLPWRAIGFGEAQQVAERQANLLLKLLKLPSAPIDVFQVTEALDITVKMRARYLMGDVMARTKIKGDQASIIVNKNAKQAVRRFTLAHEIKHVLDDRRDGYVYANLGMGDETVRGELVEKVCDHFAACLLMPKKILRRAWHSGIQLPEALADLFTVSASAVILRLRYLGLTNEEDLPTREYFKRIGRGQDRCFELPEDEDSRGGDSGWSYAGGEA